MRTNDYNKLLDNFLKEDQTDSIPDSIIDWLADMYLLKGVPLQYLIPHEALLPKESIRFFHLDDHWCKTMISGALSLGPKNDILDSLLPSIWSKIQTQVRKKIIVRSTDVHQQADFLQEDDSIKIRGILLHSDLLKHFPGIEIQAYGSDQNVLAAVRQELLKADLLLVLFLGEIVSLKISSPKESMAMRVSDEELTPTKEVLPGVLDFTTYSKTLNLASDFVSNFLHDGEYVLFETKKNKG